MDSNNGLLPRSESIHRMREKQSRAFLYEKTGEFLDYWFKLPKKGLTPEKSSIRPSDMISLLPSILMLESDEKMSQYRIRLFGTGNVGRWGFEATNAKYLELAAPQQHPALLKNFSQALSIPCGLILAGDELYTSGRVVRTEMILMPVHIANRENNILLGLITADPDVPTDYGHDILASLFYTINSVNQVNIGAGVHG